MILPPEEEFRLFEVLHQLAARWRVLALSALAVGAVAVAVTFLRPKLYTATTSFVPEASSAARRLSGNLGGLAGLAGQFGVSLGGDAIQSPRFYTEVIRSRTMRQRLLLATFPDPRPDAAAGDSATLAVLLKVRGRDRADSLEKGARRVGGLLEIKADNPTRLLKVSVETRYPTLSAGIANRLVEYLNDFNAETRQSQARERRRFVEGRSIDVERGLRDAEDRLKRFYQTNRSWQQSPETIVEEGRMRRQVDLAKELFISLRREYESARIEEVNDVPVLTVIDSAVAPKRRSSPNRRLALAFGLVAGFLGGALWVLGRDYWQRASRG